jgi:ADP-ribose pyrophosphatase YjhB (NUDIX family)
MSEQFRNPLLTVDIIIELSDGSVVLIERKNPPHGWALPGGFVDYGESVESAAKREAKEETSLDVTLLEQFYTYSDPKRDSRFHTVSTVFIATARGTPRGADDAKVASAVRQDNLPAPLVFDHGQILNDYFIFKKTGQRPKPQSTKV